MIEKFFTYTTGLEPKKLVLKPITSLSTVVNPEYTLGVDAIAEFKLTSDE
jgi:hypothetical protein